MSDADRGSSTAPDGGESVFNRVADGEVETSWSEDLRYTLDQWVVAPLRILLTDWRGLIGTLIIVGYVLMGTVGVAVLPAPSSDVMNQYLLPFQSSQYPLGTDVAGKGLLAQIVYATPPMLKMIIAGGVFAILVGALVGIVAGYVGGTVDLGLMLIADALITLPGLPLVIIISFLFEPESPYIVGIILAVNNWSGLARSVRSQVLTLRDSSYVEASRIIGVGMPSIMAIDVLPNLMPYIAVNFVGASRRIIFESVALYFLGVLPTNKPNWGVMMNTAYSTGGALQSWQTAHWLFFPMLAIILLSLGMILLSQAADQLFNPRLRAKHERGAEDVEDIGPTDEVR